MRLEIPIMLKKITVETKQQEHWLWLFCISLLYGIFFLWKKGLQDNINDSVSKKKRIMTYHSWVKYYFKKKVYQFPKVYQLVGCFSIPRTFQILGLATFSRKNKAWLHSVWLKEENVTGKTFEGSKLLRKKKFISPTLMHCPLNFSASSGRHVNSTR